MTLHDWLHRAMHQLPGVSGHDRAEELNGNRPGRVHAVKAHGAGRDRAARWNAAVNEAGAIAAARRHNSPPRVLIGVQERIARLLGQSE